MATFSVAAVRTRARLFTSMGKTADEALAEAVRKQPTKGAFDIFLSHAGSDSELVLGAKLTLEDYGYKTYIDWHDGNRCEQAKVTPDRAKVLRERMDRCRCMLYVTTAAKSECKWLPWECGYFEGRKGRTAVLPMTPTNAEIFRGQDYLGIYPYIARYQLQSQKTILVVKYTNKVYCTFDGWLNGGEGLVEG